MYRRLLVPTGRTAAARLRNSCQRIGLAALVLCGAFAASAASWDDVSATDLQATDSAGFPGVDAEILLSAHEMHETSKQRIAYDFSVGDEQLVTEHFIRAKLFTAKGVQDQGKFRIEFPSSTTVGAMRARVVKSDGQVIELRDSDRFETVLEKKRYGKEWKRITFVFPGVEPGDVIEYKWVQRIDGDLWLEHFFCQEEVPVREFRFKVGKMRNRGSIGWLHCPPAETNDRDGFTVTMRNLPAFEAEPNMPAEREFRAWLYVTRTFAHFPKDKDVWRELSLQWGDAFSRTSKPNGAIKAKAQELAAGAADDTEKLARLHEYCRTQIFNTTYLTKAEYQDSIKKHEDEEAWSPAKVLEMGRGRWDEVNLLFAALARALGYEVRMARNASREEILNVHIDRGWAFCNRPCVAVHVGATWKFFDPGSHFAPAGMLDWRDEGATALLCGPKKIEFADIPVSGAKVNHANRVGRFTLDAEGTLEGEVEVTLNGQLAMALESENWNKSREEMDKAFRTEITDRLPNAEVTDIRWSNIDDNVLPVVVRYKVRVPGYAEQAGSRLVFCPSYFENGAAPVFASAERKFPVCFRHPWSEEDDIEIVLPEGFVLDRPSAPAPVGGLETPFGVEYALKYNGKTRTFGYQRRFALGGDGAYMFRLESYPLVKQLFDQRQRSDLHSIMLKPAEEATP